MKALVSILIILAFTSCKKEEEEPILPDNSYINFELTAATDWQKVQEQGYDTSVGYFQKDDYKINYDFGHFAFGSLESIQNTSDLLYYEELEIDGNKAKIIEKNNEGEPVLLAYIIKEDGINKNRLYTYNTSKHQLFIDIVKSHKFVNVVVEIN